MSAMNTFNLFLRADQNMQDEDFQDFITCDGDWRQRIASQGKLLEPRFGFAAGLQTPRNVRINIGVQF
jgi:hypothetical protein